MPRVTVSLIPRATSFRPMQPHRHGGSALWLLVLVLVVGAFVAITLFPEPLRQLAGTSNEALADPAPTAQVDLPRTNPSQVSEVLIKPEPLQPGFERFANSSETQQIDQTNTTAAASPVRDDSAEAEELLASARKAYQAYDWALARDRARLVLQLNAAPDTMRRRAQIIIDNIPLLKDMFARLDERDELNRNFSTHPDQVVVSYRGRELHVIPVIDLDAKQVPTTDDIVRWSQGEIEARGKLTVLMATNGSGATFEEQLISDIRPVDTASIMQQVETDFNARLNRLKKGDLRGDPLAWYAAARYAYQNRIDAAVTDLLERAIYLNPRLTQAIRNDKAHDIYVKMIDQLDRGKRAAAANWKVKLDRYKDTVIYDEAAAYYRGNMEELRQARQAAIAKAKAEREQVKQARIAMARNTGDKEAVTRIEEETVVVEIIEEEPSEPVSGDVAKANELMEQGLTIYREAQAMDPVPARDRKYKKAQGYFTAARDIYYANGMEAEGVRANQLRYGCIKYRRF